MFIVHWLGAHIGAVIAGSSLATGFVMAKIDSALPAWIRKEEDLYLEKALAALSLQEDKEALKALERCLLVRFPDADVAAAQAADACIAKVPALKDYREELKTLFSAVLAASKQELEKESKP